MKRLFLPLACVLAASLVTLSCTSPFGSGGKPSFVAKHEPWRSRDEKACLASGRLAKVSYVSQTPRSSLGGPNVCGALRPLRVSATAGGRVGLKPAATLRCPMVPALERWTREVAEPAARRHFGRRLVSMQVAASYGCRARNQKRGGKLSEHGYANAIDISRFTLAGARTISVMEGWNGSPAERRFLRDVHRGACRIFRTVLGPNADRHHRDHFHFDLARHGRKGTYHYCR